MGALVEAPGATRGELAVWLSLSRASVPAAHNTLSDSGCLEQLVDRAEPLPARGRPPLRVYLARRSATSVALVLEPAGLQGGIFDLAGRELHRAHAPIEASSDAESVLAVAADLVRAMLTDSASDAERVVGAGFALPARLDEVDDAWTAERLGASLGERIRMPVALDNDVNAAAVAEHRIGAGRGCRDMLYVHLSSSIGIGMVLGDRLYRGASGLAGLLGHVSVSDAGPLCTCGNRGCVETLAGTNAILDDLARSGSATSLTGMIEAANHGDRRARRAIADAAAVIGDALAAAISLLNPARVVIGGELATAAELLLDPLIRQVGRRAVPAAATRAPVITGELQERAALVGASFMHLEEVPALLTRRLLVA